ncbi:MAG: hypothetical protein AAF799_09150 [Myxococcota bacterium]
MSIGQELALTMGSVSFMVAALAGGRSRLASLERGLRVLLLLVGCSIAIHAFGWASGLARCVLLVSVAGMLAVLVATVVTPSRYELVRVAAAIIGGALALGGWP